MKFALAVVSLLAVAGCAMPGSAEDFKWTIDCPKSVDKGAEFMFTVKTTDAAGLPVEGVKFKYQIQWTGGSANPLRHKGRTGENARVHARTVAGPATIVVTCENREGLDAKVLEIPFEVK